MYENFIGVALVIAVTLILIALLIRPIMRAILNEVRAYHKAETKDALECISKLMGSFAATVIAIMTGSKGKNPIDALLGVNTPSDTKHDE